MKQTVKKSEKKGVKTFVSQNFVGAMEEMSAEGIVKNSRQFSQQVKKDQSNFSKIKNGEGRYVTLDVIYEAVNNLGLNANFVFLEDGPKKENLLREGVVNNNNTISGNNNKVSNITPVIQAPVTGNIHIAQRIVQGMPPKERREIKKHLDIVENELLDFKKTVDDYRRKLKEMDKRLIEKDKKLMEIQDKLIRVMERQQSVS